MILGLQILNMAYKVLRDNIFIGSSRVVHTKQRQQQIMKNTSERKCTTNTTSLWKHGNNWNWDYHKDSNILIKFQCTTTSRKRFCRKFSYFRKLHHCILDAWILSIETIHEHACHSEAKGIHCSIVWELFWNLVVNSRKFSKEAEYSLVFYMRYDAMNFRQISCQEIRAELMVKWSFSGYDV